MLDVFKEQEAEQFIQRIERLQPNTVALWGKMRVEQMLAHCNVTFETVYDNKYPKPNFLMRILLKLVVKQVVVGDKPYKKSLHTAPEYIIRDERKFEAEKRRLIDYIRKTQALGANHFDGKASHSFGPLTKEEWSTLFSKHLDHHLKQFGV